MRRKNNARTGEVLQAELVTAREQYAATVDGIVAAMIDREAVVHARVAQLEAELSVIGQVYALARTSV